MQHTIMDLSKACERLGLSDSDEAVIVRMRAALTSSVVELSSLLRTGFDAVVGAEDTFYVNPDVEQPVGGLYLLRCSAGFISNVAVAVSDGLDGPYSPLPSVAIRVKESKGFVFIPESLVRNKYVKVTFDSGFSNTDDERIPDWLREVTFLGAVKALTQFQVSDGEATLSKTLPEITGLYSRILGTHLRTSSFAISPFGDV